ncbi:methyltransferase domain-containing protein [Streptomyces sp. NPDC090442]|uniref:methyltransferase domain-containing protein n=1 Tax=Streptomyces sp. NPDC090442 TaxID=3365962 RepID=UPI0038157BFA
MTTTEAEELAAVRTLLTAIADENGELPEPWASAIATVRRHEFLPRVLWQWDGDRYVRIDAEEQPTQWRATAYANTSVVTQVNDGKPVEDGEKVFPSSSASAPAIVARMLGILNARRGERVLEVGAGTGWNAALMAHVVGPQNVTTVEVDAEAAGQAAVSLERLAPGARVVVGDGLLGAPAGAPYDRIVVTCSLNHVPEALLEQTRPGGTILTPWSRPWCNYGLLHLTVRDDGSAQGRFHPYADFMPARGQRLDLRIFRDVVADHHQPTESRTSVAPDAVAGDEDFAAQFALALCLPDLWFAWHENPAVEGVVRRLWVATVDTTSWAAIDEMEDGGDMFTVWQHGPRRLWGEVEAAWAWYTAHGRPGPGRFGMTIDADGTHQPWLDSPGTPL